MLPPRNKSALAAVALPVLLVPVFALPRSAHQRSSYIGISPPSSRKFSRERRSTSSDWFPALSVSSGSCFCAVRVKFGITPLLRRYTRCFSVSGMDRYFRGMSYR
jgi:hypothetical protein